MGTEGCACVWLLLNYERELRDEDGEGRGAYLVSELHGTRTYKQWIRCWGLLARGLSKSPLKALKLARASGYTQKENEI